MCALLGKTCAEERVEEAAFRNFPPELEGHKFLGAASAGVCKAPYLRERGIHPGAVFTCVYRLCLSLFSNLKLHFQGRILGLLSLPRLSPAL